MTPPVDEFATTTGPGRRPRRAALVLLAVAVVLGLAAPAAWTVGKAVLASPDREGPDLLDAETPHVSEFTYRQDRCRYEPQLGGMVARFHIRSRETGRFTVDVEAVTPEGLGNLDITTTHVVRLTAPVYRGPAWQQLEVVVPLSEADHQEGYRKCRYTVNPTGAE